MFSAVNNKKAYVKDRTVYMELFSDRKISYKVTAGRIMRFGEEISVYGIEAEDFITGESEKIADFSPDIEDAVAFAEMLTACKVRPRQLYVKALSYLMLLI